MNGALHRRGPWAVPLFVLALLLMAFGAFFAGRGVLAASRPAASPTAPGPASSPGTLLPVTPAQAASAREQLSGLVVGERPGLAADYRRAAFGEAWADTDGNGCNQRDDVLLRDLDHGRPYLVARQGTCDHDVLAGTWVDPYTGSVTTLTDAKQQAQAESVQIDHLVALSTAWRYGARNWSDAERLAFANDLTNLLAVAGATNKAKGGSDPGTWRPAPAARCGYAVRYVGVKSRYRLPTDAVEKKALAAMLRTCG